jgi:YaiO family outer membrane protein
MKRSDNHIINNRSSKLFRILLILFFFQFVGWNNYADAQTFDEARNLAFNGERAKAREMCKAILAKGFNSDVALLLGRTYAWDGEYDSARVNILNVLKYNPDYMDAISAIADVEYWSENYDKAVEYCNLAIQKDPTAENFWMKKARILYSNDKIEEAVEVLENYLDKNPGNGEFLRKLKDYRLDLLKNSIKLSYTVDFFDTKFNRDPWQIMALSYGRKTGIGSVIARVNLADRFGITAYQYEIDAYPSFTENSYIYVNYGFSQNTIFPKHRFGFEWYQNFPKAFEGSLGMRLLGFANSNVDIYTATFGKYVGNYWLSLRSFVTPGDEGTSVSGLFFIRRYFSDPENYIGLRLGYGISPDDNRNLIDSGEKLNLKSRSVRIEYNHIINHVWIIKTGAALGSEERTGDGFAGYYTFDIGFSRLF